LPYDLTRALGLGHRLVHQFRDATGLRILDTGNRAAGGVEVIQNRAQRLVQFMRQRRRHLAHCGQPRRMQQLALQILHASRSHRAMS